MSVPETTVHEYYSLIFRKNNIRRTGQSFYVLPIPQTACKQIFPDYYFRVRLFPRYMRHYLRTFLSADRIRHSLFYDDTFFKAIHIFLSSLLRITEFIANSFYFLTKDICIQLGHT